MIFAPRLSERLIPLVPCAIRLDVLVAGATYALLGMCIYVPDIAAGYELRPGDPRSFAAFGVSNRAGILRSLFLRLRRCMGSRT